MRAWLASWRPYVVPGMLIGGGVFLDVAAELGLIVMGRPDAPASPAAVTACVLLYVAGGATALTGMIMARRR